MAQLHGKVAIVSGASRAQPALGMTVGTATWRVPVILACETSAARRRPASHWRQQVP